jgi:hypothetical protein
MINPVVRTDKRGREEISMLIKTIKDFDRHIKATDTCNRCDRRLIAPPVVTIETHKYHLECAKQLAYSILFELTGMPDLPQPNGE